VHVCKGVAQRRMICWQVCVLKGGLFLPPPTHFLAKILEKGVFLIMVAIKWGRKISFESLSPRPQFLVPSLSLPPPLFGSLSKLTPTFWSTPKTCPAPTFRSTPNQLRSPMSEEGGP
jgi:hypothetical protein